ncbi:MAG TPA: AraC family transcriptional regulator [Puia sp.]|nr:AraC family transcriptional regulator [Puia sp.]
MKKKSLPVYDITAFKHLGNDSDFYANDLRSHLKQNEHLILSPHGHNFYMSVLITAGNGTHEIEFNNYLIKPGRVFMLSPGQVHTWELSENINGYILFHTKEFYDLNFTYEKVENYPFFSSLRNTPLIILKKLPLKKIEPMFKEIVNEYRNNELMKFKKLCSIVNILYIELSREYLPQKMRDDQNLPYLARVRHLEDLINQNFVDIKSPGKYARLMFVSEKHLNRMVKVSLNKTTSDLITERIILEAKRMLVFSNKTIAEIIGELGYTDSAYFFRFFKKKTALTPTDFLQRFRKI